MMRNKETFKKSFDKITMPQYLEEEILDMMKKNKKTAFIKFSTAAAAAAAILTIGIAGAFAQNLGLFDFLVANKDVTPEQQQLVQQTNLEATVDGVTFQSREFLFDGDNLYIRAEVTSKDNKFVAGDDEIPKVNPEQYKAIGVGLFGGEIAHNRVDWSYEEDGTLVYVIKAETKSLEDINVRFVVRELDENGNSKSDAAANGEKIPVPFTEIPLVK